MCEIDEKYIKEAEIMEKKRNFVWIKYAVAAAACLGIGVGAVTLFRQTGSVPVEPANTSVSAAVITSASKNNNAVSDDKPAEEIEEVSDSGSGGDYNAAIMINGVIYWDTYETIPVEIDESVIKYAVSYAESGMPENDGETNFAREPGTKYAVLGDGTVVVEIDGEWTVFRAKDGIDGTVPGGSFSGGLDPVKASIAVLPSSESIDNIADATLTQVSETDAKQLDGIGKYLPSVLPDGYSMETASSYETTMKDGTIYRRLRLSYTDNGSKTAAPSNEEEFINELNIDIFNFRPENGLPFYSADALPDDLELYNTFMVAVGDAYALVDASNLTVDDIKAVLGSMG